MAAKTPKKMQHERKHFNALKLANPNYF